MVGVISSLIADENEQSSWYRIVDIEPDTGSESNHHRFEIEPDTGSESNHHRFEIEPDTGAESNSLLYRDSFKRDQNSQNTNGSGVLPKDGIFERFWSAFPAGRKSGKAKAREAWSKAIKKTDPEAIITAAGEYAGSEVGRGEFVKMPTTWLNGECWDDDRSAWAGAKATAKILSDKPCSIFGPDYDPAHPIVG